MQFSLTETTARVYRKVWEMAALAGSPDRDRQSHVIAPGKAPLFFTGATASLRDRANFSAFASSSPPRLAQSARAGNLGDVHVATDLSTAPSMLRLFATPSRLCQRKEQDGILNPDIWRTLASTSQITGCGKLDLRPWTETF
jgi:hypothetical protein